MSIILKYCMLLLCTSQISGILGHMHPIKKGDRYYYSQEDTYIDLKRALTFLSEKVLSPTVWFKALGSLFYSSPEKSDAVTTLKPTQMVPEKESVKPKIVWVGHATFLIQMNKFNILTDPVFGHVKAGPITLTKRAMPPGIKLEDLPHIDVIVISHNHSDHTDTNTLMALAKKYDPIVYVPLGNKELIKSMGFSRVVENSWWDTNELKKDGRKLIVSCLPAYHWSIRFSLGSYRKALWSSWMLSSNKVNIYFAGDTAYGKHFKEIAQDFPSIDAALMPVGPTCEGKNRHAYCHVDATQAIDAFIDLNAQCFVPMHYGTFFIGKEMLEYPIERLKKSWQGKKDQLKNKVLLLARVGQQYDI